ncbi:MAG: hypothetical protein RBU30_06400 [Polyangia bacterium]|nr:hypothetical protein [Polyangia bacterium]
MSLRSLAPEYEGDVVFLTVVREDGAGEPATVDYADWYADDKSINFPTVADVGGYWGPFMMDGYPTNLIIDLTAMVLKYTRSGLMTETDIRGRLTQYMP